MCGLAGYSLRHGHRDLDPVIQAIAHRGPDGHGTFQDDEACVGLAHVRLSIIDLGNTGCQPMQRKGGKFVLSYNGEIYNYQELRSELEERGVKFVGGSDTEVLLALLDLDGLHAISRLNGMFGFAAFDTISQETVVVRDAYGIKPIYYSTNEDGAFFSSEVRGLTAMGVNARLPDPLIAARHMAFVWNPSNQTLNPNVYKLAPGEAVVFRGGEVLRRWIWFTSPMAMAPEKTKILPIKQCIAQTADHLRNATHRQLVADVPVGAFLSGGLDSSAIVAFAKEKIPDIKCFTISPIGGPEPGTPDDLPYAKRVAKHLNVSLEIVEVDSTSMAQDLEEMVVQLEEPLADPACLNVLYISRKAREQGIKVLLSGSGGDDLFTGYRRHQAIALDAFAQHLPVSLREKVSAVGGKLSQKRSIFRRTSKFLKGFDLSGDERLLEYFFWSQREDIIGLLSKEARAYIGSSNLAEPIHAYLTTISNDRDSIDRALAIEQRFFLPEHNLLYTDKMSMAAGVEVRVPFLDLELAEFTCTIPTRWKQRGGTSKWILKKAMEPYLPKDMIYRPKAGFGAPLRRWLEGDLRDTMEDLLSDATLKRRGLFDVVSVRQLIDDSQNYRKDGSYTILSMMCLELWCRNVTKP